MGDQFQQGATASLPSSGDLVVGHVASVNCLMPFDTTLRCNVACWPKEESSTKEGACPAIFPTCFQIKTCARGARKRKSRLVSATKEDLHELRKQVHREPHLEEDVVIRSSLTPHFNQDGGAQIGTLDSCPFLKAGACDWFSVSDTMESEAMKRDAQSEFFAWVVPGPGLFSKDEQNQEDGRIEERLYRDLQGSFTKADTTRSADRICHLPLHRKWAWTSRCQLDSIAIGRSGTSRCIDRSRFVTIDTMC